MADITFKYSDFPEIEEGGNTTTVISTSHTIEQATVEQITKLLKSFDENDDEIVITVKRK